MVRTLRRFSFLLLSATLLIGVLTACSSAYQAGSVPVVMTAAPSGGALAMTDAAALDPVCLPVVVSRVEVVPVDGEGEEAEGPILGFDVNETFDLTDHSAVDSETLGSIGLDELLGDGVYGQVRFIVDTAHVGFDGDQCGEGGELSPVFVPSGPQTGLKVKLDPPVTVDELSGAEAVFLEFDVDRLIATSDVHPYLLSPTAVRAYVKIGD